MPIELDGLKVLRAIVDDPKRFPAALKDVNKVGHSLLTKQVKAAKTHTELAELAKAVGSDSLALVVEGFSDRDLATLVKRIDGHNPDVAAMAAAGRRLLILALAEGRAEPAPAPKRPARGARSRPAASAAGQAPSEAPPAEPKRTMRNKSMGAVREKKR